MTPAPRRGDGWTCDCGTFNESDRTVCIGCGQAPTSSSIVTATSPFDAIRRIDEAGEYWTGRELMPVMEYSKWERFAEVIERAKASLALVQGPEQAEHHFPILGSDGGRWGNQKLDDFRLTRFGAYLTAMAGDDTKEAVAHARVYFAVKTREAETGAAGRELSRLELIEIARDAELERLQAVEERDEARAELAIAGPKAEYVDSFVNGDDDASTFRVVANQLKIGEKDLRNLLIERKAIYRKLEGRRWSRSQGRMVPEYSWHAYGTHRAWFTEQDQPEAPRYHNGQMRTTLYVTPVGKVKLAELVRDRGAA